MIIHLRKSPIALALMCALPWAASAQQALKLRMQTTIVPLSGGEADARAPLYMQADRMQGHTERDTEASGNAIARSRGQAFAADWMRFDHRINELTAIGNVHFEEGAYTVDGLRLRYDLDTERGVMESARYAVNPRATGNLPVAPAAPAATTSRMVNGRGDAQRIVFDGPELFRAQKANFTTCEPGNDGWQLRAEDLALYRDKGLGVARHATVAFQGIPSFYTPYLSFPLHNERKSGFLAPHYGTSSTSGVEFSVPYYWAMAPNYDLTVTPRMMVRRGLQLRNDFRYLQPSYRGELAYEVLPNDRLADTSRQLLKLKHTQTLWTDWTAAIDVTKVTDDRYFSDLSSSVGLTSLTNLTRQASISRGGIWGDGGTYGFTALVQGWQTLQTDPLVPLVAPYSRRPQLSLTAQRLDTLGGDFNFEGSYAHFDHPTLVRGKRLLAYPSLTLPLQSAAAYFTPKAGMHMTRYFIDPKTSTLPDASRVLPILSATSGLNFERSTRLFGNGYTQTLEPTAYYVYIPNRNQDRLPNFESGLQDINFATIFSENQFSGQDRINDANQLTLGVRSRLIQPANGTEILRAGLAQRYYFKAQEVTVPGVPARTNQSARSDLLAALNGTVAPHLTVDLGWQFNTDERQTARSNLAMRYQPQQGKLLNLAYRQNVSAGIRQVDISGQWPVFNRWNAVGRWNYSTQDRRLLEGLGGLEYDGGCFVFRVVAHRVSTATSRSNTAFFLELELNGLTSVGSNSLNLLRRNIAGYWRADPRAARPDDYFVPER